MIKIDVEGAELDVLRGLSSTIGRYKPLIVFEFLPTDIHLYPAARRLPPGVQLYRRERGCQLEAWFRNMGYVVVQIRVDSEPKSVKSLVEFGENRSLSGVNFLAVPNERLSSLGLD